MLYLADEGYIWGMKVIFRPLKKSINLKKGGILILLVVRSPKQISEPYDNLFWDFSNGGEKSGWNNT